jgi:hypothetical protein
MKNDLQITHWEREVKNRTRELADAIRDRPVWVVMEKAKEVAHAANELRYRAIAIGFEKHPPHEVSP